MPYMSDPTIVTRVQKYLETNVDKTYVDITVMADELQRQYREYAKRKRSAFRASVNKAYSIVLANYGWNKEDESQSSNGETVDDSSEEGLSPDTTASHLNNSLNNQLIDLYSKPKKAMNENELIDISSDDSQDSPPSSTHQSQKQKEQEYNRSISEASYQAKLQERYTNEMMKEYERGKKRKLDYATISAVKNVQTKKKKPIAISEQADYSFKDVGGMDKTLEEVCKLLLHISHPEIYTTIGITPPRGFLLHGPPGCGKTLLANAIAGELGVPLLKVAAPELVAGVSGGSEERIRDLFEEAGKISPCVLFIDEIDAITPNRQNVQKDMEKRIVAQLLSCLDDLNKSESGSRVLVIGATSRPDAIDPALRRAGRFDKEISLGFPNKESRSQILKILTKKLKLSKDFDFDELARYSPGYVGADLLALSREAAMVAVSRLLKGMKDNLYTENKKAPSKKEDQVEKEEATPSKNTSTESEVIVDDEPPKESENVNGTTQENEVLVVEDEELDKTAKNGEVTEKKSDSPIEVEEIAVPEEKSLTNLEEMILWLHDTLPLSEEELDGLCITMDDFKTALKNVQPSSKREGFATVPNVSWDDVGSLKDIREELQMSIVAPVRHSKEFEEMGITVPTGVLLCGPPGCGKTLLAKAIANEAGINFISVKGPELLNMYVGESERAVRVCFERARNSIPCVIFFDELDALCPKRSTTGESSSTMRVVNQLLTEMDGIGSRKDVFLLAASNRPDIIDPAILRPGRLDKILYVGLPTSSDRVDILRAVTKNGTSPKLAPDVNLEEIATSEQCSSFTGADLVALVKEAGVLALKDVFCGQRILGPVMVTSEHFKRAFSKIRPSVPEKDRAHYEKLRKIYSSLPKDREVEEMELS